MTLNPAILYAAPSRSALERRLKDGRYQQSDGQLEKRCCACKEYWPADTEFFYRHRGGADGLSDYCKACHAAMREASMDKNLRAA